jgi:hypothetical protein
VAWTSELPTPSPQPPARTAMSDHLINQIPKELS